MLTVLKGSWALFLGMLLLMLGNGLQGTACWVFVARLRVLARFPCPSLWQVILSDFWGDRTLRPN